MTSLKPVTDEGLEAERRRGMYLRGEKIDNAVNAIIIKILWAGGTLLIIAMVYGTGLYMYSLFNPYSVDPSSITRIEHIATNLLAGGVGYLAHLLKRNINT